MLAARPNEAERARVLNTIGVKLWLVFLLLKE